MNIYLDIDMLAITLYASFFHQELTHKVHTVLENKQMLKECLPVILRLNYVILHKFKTMNNDILLAKNVL